MMRRKFLHGVEGGILNLMMTEVCGATNCILMEVGGSTSHMMMEVGGATKSTLSNSVR